MYKKPQHTFLINILSFKKICADFIEHLIVNLTVRSIIIRIISFKSYYFLDLSSFIENMLCLFYKFSYLVI